MRVKWFIPTLLLALIGSFTSLGHAQEKVTLEFMYWAEDPVRIGFFEAHLDGFRERNPNVTVNGIPIPFSQYGQQLQTRLAAGNVPDVIRVRGFEVADFWRLGALLPLDDFIAADPDFDPSTWSGYDAMVLDGQVVGLPFFRNVDLFEYNAQLFFDSEVTPPDLFVPSGEWTWEKYVEIGKEITQDRDGDGRPDQYLEAPGSALSYVRLITLLRSEYGIDPFTEDGRDTNLDSPEAAAALQFMVDLVQVHGIVPEPEADLQGMGLDYSSGNIALNHNHWAGPNNTRIRLLQGNPLYTFQSEVVSLPHGAHGLSSNTHTAPIAVSTSTDHSELAYQLARWMVGEEVGREVAKERERPLGDNLKFLRSNEYWELFPGVDPKWSLEALEIPSHTQPAQNQAQVYEILDNEIILAVEGAKTPEQALADFARQARRLIQ